MYPAMGLTLYRRLDRYRDDEDTKNFFGVIIDLSSIPIIQYSRSRLVSGV